jgi:tRNA-Thr(GGU) m(6)t(6)A37 methyltransferase TsaA
MSEKTNSYQLHPVGTVHRTNGAIQLEIDEAFRPALKELDHFSHVLVFWWAHHLDNNEGRGVLQINPPYAEEHLTGIFATRSPARPNPIAVTACKLLSIDEEAGTVRVADIDALDGSPVVDLKGYYPVCDRVKEAHIPEWLADWPEWMPDDGLGLEPWEQ